MEVCPLCEEAVMAGATAKEKSAKEKRPDYKKAGKSRQSRFETSQMSRPQRKATWELVSIIIILLILATTLINYIINKEISWSEYPVAVCLIIFSYVSSFAFLNKRREIQLISAFFTASVFIIGLDALTGSESWALQLGVPLLFFANMIVMGLLFVFRSSGQRGINLIAYSFLAAALLCISIEATVDRYASGHINLVWSLIVSACLFPVAVVLLFMHFRLKKGRDLNKTFHI